MNEVLREKLEQVVAQLRDQCYTLVLQLSQYEGVESVHFSTRLSIPEGVDLDEVAITADRVMGRLYRQAVPFAPGDQRLVSGNLVKPGALFVLLQDIVQAGYNCFCYSRAVDGEEATMLVLKPAPQAHVSVQHALLDLKRELMIEWHQACHESQVAFIDPIDLGKP